MHIAQQRGKFAAKARSCRKRGRGLAVEPGKRGKMMFTGIVTDVGEVLELEQRGDLRAGLLVPVLPEYRRQGHGVHMVYPSRRYLPLAVSAFIDLVISKMGAMQELPPQGEGE